MPVPNVTIEEYLQILPNFVFPIMYISRAMARYGIESGVPAYQPDPETGKEPEAWQRKRDLAEAVMWDTAAGLVNGGGSRKQMGNRSYTDMNIQTSEGDREVWRSKANALRKKWGEVIEEENLAIYDATLLW